MATSVTSRLRRLPRVRWYELLPEAVLGAGLLAFLVDQTDPALSAFGSTRAILIMLGIGATWIVGRLVLARVLPWPLARTAVFAAGAAATLALVVLPAYHDETVVEVLPVARRPAVAAPAGPTAAPGGGTPAATPTDPVAVRSGELRGIDHRASGRVSVYRQPNGRFTVGLEEIDIQPGPDYDVYIVPGADRASRGDGAVRLDDLRGNKGTQFYDVPAGPDLARGQWTVLVWCQTFGVPVAASTVTPV